VAAGFALRIDALHGEAGQVLHFFSLRGRKAQVDPGAALWRSRPEKVLNSPWRRNSQQKSREKTGTKKRRASLRKKSLRTSNRDGGHCGAVDLWCQEEMLQAVVVRLQE
jgi:hypothetical protein